MSKVAVVYWSGTGNTEQMAQQVAEGAKQAGAEVSLFSLSLIHICTKPPGADRATPAEPAFSGIFAIFLCFVTFLFCNMWYTLHW